MPALLPDKKRPFMTLKRREGQAVDMTVSPEVQREYHLVAPVEDTSTWGSSADPTFFSQMLTIAGFAKMFSSKPRSRKGGSHEQKREKTAAKSLERVKAE